MTGLVSTAHSPPQEPLRYPITPPCPFGARRWGDEPLVPFDDAAFSPTEPLGQANVQVLGKGVAGGSREVCHGNNRIFCANCYGCGWRSFIFSLFLVCFDARVQVINFCCRLALSA